MTPLKSLAKHSSIYSAGSILGKIIAFVMIPVYTRYLTTADYGILEILVLVSSVTSLLFSMKLSAGMVRHYFEFKEQSHRNQLISSQYWMVAVVAVAAAAILISQARPVAMLLFDDPVYSLHVSLIFCVVVFEILNETSYAYLRIIEKSTLYVLFTTLHLILGFCFNILMIVVFRRGVLGVLLSMVISSGTVCLILLVYSLRRVGLGFALTRLRPVIRFSLPLLPAGLLMFVLNMGDRFLINHLRGAEEVGIYSLGYRFGMLLSLFVGNPFLQTWQYKRVELFENGMGNDPLFSRILIYISIPLAFVGLTISLLTRSVLAVIAAPSFQSASSFVPLVVAGYYAYILLYVFDVGIFLRKKTGWYILINAAGAGVNVGLNVILIPRIGAMGAAVATVVSFSVCPVIAYLISRRYLTVRYDFKRFALITGLALLLYGVGISVPIGNLVLATGAKLLLIVLYPVLLLITGIFLPEEVAAVRRALRRLFRTIRGFGQPVGPPAQEDLESNR